MYAFPPKDWLAVKHVIQGNVAAQDGFERDDAYRQTARRPNQGLMMMSDADDDIYSLFCNDAKGRRAASLGLRDGSGFRRAFALDEG